MMVHVWKPRADSHEKVREDRCRASVADGRAGLFQCSRKGKVECVVDEKTYLFCTQHHPDTVAKREKAWRARYDADQKRVRGNHIRRRLENETMQLLANLDEAEVPKAVRDWVRKWKELEED